MRQTVRSLALVMSACVLAACGGDLKPTPEALPKESPNEAGVLISSEGQAVIDAVLSGHIDAPDLITEPLELIPDGALTPQGTVPYAVRHPWASTMSHFLWHRNNRNPS